MAGAEAGVGIYGGVGDRGYSRKFGDAAISVELIAIGGDEEIRLEAALTWQTTVLGSFEFLTLPRNSFEFGPSVMVFVFPLIGGAVWPFGPGGCVLRRIAREDK